MNFPARRTFAAASLLILPALAGCGSSSRVKAASLTVAAKRKAAPDFELKDIDGKVIKLSDFKGKVVLLDFWATWCGPCKIEIPWFKEFERSYKDQGLVVLGIAMDDEGWVVVKPFLRQLAVNYRVVMGSDSTADLYGGISALPTTFLIDREGKIGSTHVGLVSKADFEDGIKELLGEGAGTRVSAGGDLRAGPN